MLPSRYFPALLALALLSCIIPYGLNVEESTCGVSSAVGGCPAKVDSNKILTGHLPRQVTIVQWVQKNDFLADKYTCNGGSMQCEVTLDRQRIRDRNTAAVIWHSCDIDLLDMPRFRAPHHSWILFNDESPCGHVVQQVPECLSFDCLFPVELKFFPGFFFSSAGLEASYSGCKECLSGERDLLAFSWREENYPFLCLYCVHLPLLHTSDTF